MEGRIVEKIAAFKSTATKKEKKRESKCKKTYKNTNKCG